MSLHTQCWFLDAPPQLSVFDSLIAWILFVCIMHRVPCIWKQKIYSQQIDINVKESKLLLLHWKPLLDFGWRCAFGICLKTMTMTRRIEQTNKHTHTQTRRSLWMDKLHAKKKEHIILMTLTDVVFWFLFMLHKLMTLFNCLWCYVWHTCVFYKNICRLTVMRVFFYCFTTNVPYPFKSVRSIAVHTV